MKYITFGEIMLRLNPVGYERFLQADRFLATYAGAEASVAVSLASYGQEVGFVTKLPANQIGQAAVNSVRRYGVNTDKIARGGKRIGIYYVEKGASQRAGKVIYDREGSAISEAVPSDFNWDGIFEGCSWFHFTGITPALSDGVADICLEAVRKAKEHGLTVSCDLNYRSKLWSREKARAVMSGLAKYVDVCIGNEEDAGDVFGIYAEKSDINTGKLSDEGYKNVAKQLADKFGFRYVAITLRESLSASDNNWSAMLYDGKDYYVSKKYAVHIVDRLGGGDSFGAGLLYSLGNGYGCRDAIEFAVAASCLKHTIEGDFNLVDAEEVAKLAGGEAGGRVQR